MEKNGFVMILLVEVYTYEEDSSNLKKLSFEKKQTINDIYHPHQFENVGAEFVEYYVDLWLMQKYQTEKSARELQNLKRVTYI